MTDEDARETEHRLAEQVARQLVGEGYEVFVQPGPQLLPRELVGLQPDILARRGDENLIVEVKLAPSSEGAEQVKRIAQVVKSLPGWQVRLITAPKPEPSSPWTLAEAEARIEDAARLAEQGYREAALVLLLAAAEAIGRQLASGEQVRVQRWSPVALFRGLVHHGLIDREDAERLVRAYVLRNRIVHGIADRSVESAELADVLEAVKRLGAEARDADNQVRELEALLPHPV